MPIDEAEFRQRKRQAEQARQTRDKASGQLEAAMERLHTEFDCDTIEDAEKKASKFARDAARAEKEYDLAAKEFEEAWSEHAED